MESNWAVLPEDVVITILLWLPVASLLRFKSVCKSWCSFIESSHFITQHLGTLKDNNDDHHLLILDPSQCDVSTCYSLEFSLISCKNYQVSKDLELPHRFDNALERPKIIASCNGIICLQPDLSQNVSLWNPATKEFRILPKPSVPPAELDTGSRLDFFFGFGYDVESNDYKVVKVITLNQMTSRVELYSLSTDSWRHIDTVVPLNKVLSHLKAPLRNEIYCWLGCVEENESERHTILSFDFTTEVFGTIPVPDVYGLDSTAHLRLALLRENIACTDWVFYSADQCIWHCNIWVLSEYGVKESWTKLYTIVLEPFAYPIEVLMNGKIIGFENGGEGGLCYCDLVTPEIKNLPFHPCCFLTAVVIYKESLVSVKSTICATNKDISKNQP